MADETPDTPATPPRRRRGPNKPKPDGTAPVPRNRSVRSVAATVASTAERAEQAVTDVAGKSAAAVSGAAKSAVKAAKPRAGKRATPRSRAKPAAKRKPRVGVGAIAGGLAAVGAATATLFALRSGAKKAKRALPAPAAVPEPTKATSHQPDGTDSSKSFQAGIADENMIPDAS